MDTQSPDPPTDTNNIPYRRRNSIGAENQRDNVSTSASSDSATGHSSTNTSSTSSSSTSNAGASSAPKSDSNEASFECNICLDTAKDAVVSFCGHLFCWPCLHQWLDTRPNRQVCPVCKAAISRDKVIPLYGRGGSNKDPRDKLPPRPPGQRTEPEPQTGTAFPGFGFADGGFHMSFGIGAFPFGFFASTLNFGDGRPQPFPFTAAATSGELDQDQFLSKLFLWIGIIFIFWLLIA